MLIILSIKNILWHALLYHTLFFHIFIIFVLLKNIWTAKKTIFWVKRVFWLQDIHYFSVYYKSETNTFYWVLSPKFVPNVERNIIWHFKIVTIRKKNLFKKIFSKPLEQFICKKTNNMEISCQKRSCLQNN